MGILNMRARCPNCGGLIHTKPTPLGSLTWMRNGPLLVTTGKECQWCGVQLTGKVDWNNTAILASPSDQRDANKAPKRAVRATNGNGSKKQRRAQPKQKVYSQKRTVDAAVGAGKRIQISAVEKRIVGALRSHGSQIGVYVFPRIPKLKGCNAKKSCAVPDSEAILGLIDCTFFGSALDALVFGQQALYYHNKVGNRPDPGMLPYADFPTISFGSASRSCNTLGDDSYCNTAGSGIARDRIIGMLAAIKEIGIEELEKFNNRKSF